MEELQNERREYKRSVLRRSKLNADPFTQFSGWVNDAKNSSLTDPTAMVLATSDERGQKSQRSVLMKGFNQKGIVFFTNLNSKKFRDIKKNTHVSALFPWFQLDRQVHINGQTELIERHEVIKYFKSRPRMSQISAWASEQSSKIASKKILEKRFDEFEKRFTDREIDVPDFWGGIRIIPVEFEFWQGGERRLHDRFRYTKRDNCWIISRLSP